MLLLLLITINVISIFGEDAICIWNIINQGTGNSYTRLNGVYEYKKELYTKPFYANNNTACGDAVFLYFKINRWYLGTYPDPDPFTVGGLSGRCQQTAASSKDPTGCGSNWAVPYVDNTTFDSNIAAINSKCPAWNDECTEIKIVINPSTTDGCDGTFIYDANFGDNVYSKYVDESSTIYWYFNFHAFQWICSNIVNFDTCTPSGSLQESFAGDYWKDINVDGTINVDLVSTNVLTVSCLTTAKPTPSPTKNPLAPPDGDSSSNIIYLNLGIIVMIVFLWSLL